MPLPRFIKRAEWAPPVMCTREGEFALTLTGVTTDPAILFEGGEHRVYFSTYNFNGGAIQLGTCYSYGVEPNILFPPGIPGADGFCDLNIRPGLAWDADGCETVSIAKTGSTYAAIYAGRAGNTYVLGLATSPDMITFTKRPDPILQGSLAWDTPGGGFGGCLEPSFLYDPALGLWRLWYVGWNGVTFSIGHATSPDLINWTKWPTPVFVPAVSGWDSLWVSHVNVVADPEGGFRMYYWGNAASDYDAGALFQRGSIGEAVSTDGFTWTRNPTNPILTARNWSCGGPAALVRQGKVRLWYFDGERDYSATDILYTEAPLAASGNTILTAGIVV